MAVQAPDRPECLTQPLPVDGLMGWMEWLSKLLNDRVWIGLAVFEPSVSPMPVLKGYPNDIAALPAATLLARKAHLADKVQSVSINSQRSDNPHERPRENSCSTGAPGQPIRQTLLAIPLTRRVDSRVVLLLQGPAYAREQLSATIKLCRWASVWLHRDKPVVYSAGSVHDGVEPSSNNSSKPECTASARLAESVVQALHVYGTPVSVSVAIANTVKQVYPCQRVSIAVQPSGSGSDQLRLLCISDQIQIDHRKVLPTRLVEAMNEKLAYGSQSGEQPDAMLENPAVNSLYEDHGGYDAHLVSVQSSDVTQLHVAESGELSNGTRVVALVERVVLPDSADQKDTLTPLLEPALGVLVKLIDEQQSDWQRGHVRVKRWMGLQHYAGLSLKQWASGVIAVLLILALFIPVPLRITAKAAIVAKDLHVLIAPHTGFVSSAHVRAGDVVVEGQVMATLDVRDLQLAADKWTSELIKNAQSMDKALATGDRVEVGRLSADARRILAEQSLVERQLQRSQLRAPFAGVVLSGDLTQQLGSSVKQGDTLFTLAASDEYRLVLDVDEGDVGLVSADQPVRVRMAALPDKTWIARVEGLQPVATTIDQANVFRVPAQLREHAEELRPGMEGIAKLYAGRQILVMAYTRTLRVKIRWLLWRMGLIR